MLFAFFGFEGCLLDGFLWALLVVCFRWVALCLGWRGRQRWRKRREEGEAREQGKGKGGGRKEKEARREEGGCNEMGLEGDRRGANEQNMYKLLTNINLIDQKGGSETRMRTSRA